MASPSTEEACRRARINKTTVYEWLRDETFRHELKRQRVAVIERALDSLKATIAKASETLVKLLDSDKEAIRARAAENTSSNLRRRRLSMRNWKNGLKPWRRNLCSKEDYGDQKP